MFEYLSKYLNILVTGPQRSGTRITAKMIAHDLKYRFVDEEEIKISHDGLVLKMLDTQSHLVIQCPGLCYKIDGLSRDNIAIVLVKRKVEDIIRSQQRVKWDSERFELSKYGFDQGNISSIKYEFWDAFQKQRIHHPFEVEYDSLKSHPLWVSPEGRVNFQWNQTSLESG